MSESKQHRDLVEMLIKETEKMVGPENSCLIESDIADDKVKPKLTLEGYRPDVFYQYENVMIIGEAKTSEDVERSHSQMQYRSYMKKCSLFKGEATLLIGVPWTEYATVHNLTHRIQKDYPGDYKITILKGIGI